MMELDGVIDVARKTNNDPKRWLDEITTTQEEKRTNERIQRRFAGAMVLGMEGLYYHRVEEEKKAAATQWKWRGKSKSSRKNSERSPKPMELKPCNSIF